MFLSFAGVVLNKFRVSEIVADEFGEVSDIMCVCELVRELADNGIKVDAEEDRANGDRDALDEPCAVGRQLNVGSWRI